MADCCLTLIEEAVFHFRQTENVRMLLKRMPDDRRSDKRYLGLVTRLKAAETTESEQTAAKHPSN
jgi:hypothetical protein